MFLTPRFQLEKEISLSSRIRDEYSINCHGKVLEFYYQISVGRLYQNC